ncbi:MAG TPA: M20/M25/M40 family metallo-hydrolase [Sphingomicrobium sp.]|nr:M20/M25/M40 family metallo-hydrolase [Sphingomicrobium sp.]
MKRVALAAGLVVLALVAVLAFNTLRLERQPLADAAPPAPAVDERALDRLAGAIRIPTISSEAGPPSAESLAAFHDHLRASFPLVHARLAREVIAGHSLLYTWAGSDGAVPALLLAAHQDVVPVEAGSEGKWAHPPFSGAIAGGFVWGRGAIDDKASLMAILEAVERLLERGFQPRQTIYLAFGHDEEIGGNGARAMAAALRARRANIGFALDEGSAVTDGVVAGVTVPVALIGIAEKGYLSVELSASGSAGHSSMPGDDNAAVRIARAVDRLASQPFPARLDGPTGAMLDDIAPYTDWPLRIALANRWLSAPLVRRQLLASPQSAAAIRTTTAPSILAAGTKDNVLPQTARAAVNHRLLPGDTVDSVLARDRAVVDDPQVKVRPLGGATDPTPVADARGEDYTRFAALVRSHYPHAAVARSLVLGATDGRHYAGVARTVLRFLPLTLGKEDLARFHGNDERVSVGDYMRAIGFYERLMAGERSPKGRP